MTTEAFPPTTTSFEGELAELYAHACACSSKEAELVIACFVYRVRHSDRSRLEVSREVTAALKAAGCVTRKHISACSLGMWRCQQVNGCDEYFGEWSRDLSFNDDQQQGVVSSFRGCVQKVASVLQAKHLERIRAQKSPNQCINHGLSLRKLYQVFRKVRIPEGFGSLLSYFTTKKSGPHKAGPMRPPPPQSLWRSLGHRLKQRNNLHPEEELRNRRRRKILSIAALLITSAKTFPPLPRRQRRKVLFRLQAHPPPPQTMPSRASPPPPMKRKKIRRRRRLPTVMVTKEEDSLPRGNQMRGIHTP